MRSLGRLLLIHEGEGNTVFYMLSLLLLVGFGMSLGNATANTLFLKRYGIDFLPTIYLLQALLCFASSFIYASLADVVSSEGLFKRLFSILSVALLIFWLLITLDLSPKLFPVYYLFYEITSEVLLVHTALYLNQNLNTLQAKRLAPVIFSGHQIGVILGGVFLTLLTPLIGTKNMLLVWVLEIIFLIFLITKYHARTGASPYFRATKSGSIKLNHMARQVEQGFRFAISSDLLRASIIAMVFMVITYYVISYSVKSVYSKEFANEEQLAEFFGMLSILSGILAITLQMFFTNRLIDRFGVPVANLFYPLVLIASFVGMIFHFTLPMAVIGTMNNKAVMPAVHNSVRTMFLNVLPQQIQGRARAMAIAIVLPVSLFICGITLNILQNLQDSTYILIMGLSGAGLFLYFSIRMNKAYGQTLIKHLREHLFLPGGLNAASLRMTGSENIDSIISTINKCDESSVIISKILVEAYPDTAVDYIMPVIKEAKPPIADQLIKVITDTNSPALGEYLVDNYRNFDNHLRSTALKTLFISRYKDAIKLIRDALYDNDPRIQSVAIECVLCWPLDQLEDDAIKAWLNLFEGGEKQKLSAIEKAYIIDEATLANNRVEINSALQRAAADIYYDQQSTGKIAILKSLQNFGNDCNDDTRKLILDALKDDDPVIRKAALPCTQFLQFDQWMEKIEYALDDGNVHVRNAALNVLSDYVSDMRGTAVEWVLDENRGAFRAQLAILGSVSNELPAALLEKIASKKIESARLLHEELTRLRRQSNMNSRYLTLLLIVLEERIKLTIEIALCALEPISSPNVIDVARAGVKTLDERYIADACEVLYSTPGNKLAKQLGLLIQDTYLSKSSPELNDGESVDVIMDVLQKNGDSWLRECIDKALYEQKHLNDVVGGEIMSDIFERILFLKQSGIFSKVPTDDLRYIAQALEDDVFFAGERIFDINDQGDYLYVITEGKIGISINPDPLKKEFVAVIGQGETFGEMNLVDELPRSATAHVVEDAKVLKLEKSRLSGLLLSYPEISVGIMRALSLKIRENHLTIKGLKKQLEEQ